MNTPGVPPSSASRLPDLPQHPHDGTEAALLLALVMSAACRTRAATAAGRAYPCPVDVIPASLSRLICGWRRSERTRPGTDTYALRV